MNIQKSAVPITLSIIIINFNGEAYIRKCLDSIFENPCKFSYEILVVDNASVDQSISILQSYGDKIKVYENAENVGFSRANNQCLPFSKGKYLLLLNNDTQIHEGALQRLIDFYEENPEAAALSPKLFNADGSVQVQGSIFGAWQFYSKKVRKVPFICGASLVTTKAFFESIGGFDEALFFYNDDIDFCKQAKKASRPIYYVPQAGVTHFGGLSTKTRRVDSIVDGYLGGLYLSQKFYGRFVQYLYRGILLIDLIPKILIRSFFLASEKHKPYIKAYLKVLKIVVLGDR